MSKLVKYIVVALIIFSSASFLINNSYSQDNTEKAGLKEFSVLSGWASGDLKRQDDYRMVPLLFQFAYDMSPLLKKINFNFPGESRFVLEPFLNTILSPDSNIETGCNFILKYLHPVIGKLKLYIEGGLGLLYTTQHTYEQSTQFNFSEQFGGGLSFLISENKAINAGYRYRHFSNAGIDQPNKGVDMEFIILGITFLY